MNRQSDGSIGFDWHLSQNKENQSHDDAQVNYQPGDKGQVFALDDASEEKNEGRNQTMSGYQNGGQGEGFDEANWVQVGAVTGQEVQIVASWVTFEKRAGKINCVLNFSFLSSWQIFQNWENTIYFEIPIKMLVAVND